MLFIDVTEPKTFRLGKQNIERVFKAQLEELTEGWYIARSNGILGRREKYDSTSTFVLCKESEPHPHNGDTSREFEERLDAPKMHKISKAVQLYDALYKK